MNRKVLVLVLAMTGVSFAYSNTMKTVDATRIYGVSNFAYTMDGKQAVSISFGESEKKWCSATIHRNSVKADYKAEINQKNSGELSIDCNWAGKHFVQSSKHPTSTAISIKSLDKSSRTAVLYVSIKLVEPRSNDYLNLGTQKLVISGEYFDHLIKKM